MIQNIDFSTIGKFLFAIAVIGYGILNFVYGDFIMGRPPAWPSGVPGHMVWTYLTGGVFILCGIAIVIDKKAREAAVLIGLMVFFWSFVRHIIAWHWQWGGEITNTCKALNKFTGAFAVAGVLPLASRVINGSVTKAINQSDVFFWLGRFGLGVFMVISGVQHFMFVEFVSQLIPGWIPGKFAWTYFAGVALIAGGIGVQFNRTLKLAALLSGFMIFTWCIILHTPRAFLGLGTGTEWIGVVGSLSTSGIAFVLAGMKSNAKVS
jgi:uncharacterized membrane protein